MAASSGGEVFRPRLISARRFPRRRRAQVTSTNARPEGAQGLAVDQVTEAVAAFDTSKNTALHQYVSGVYRFGARHRCLTAANRRSGPYPSTCLMISNATKRSPLRSSRAYTRRGSGEEAASV